MDTLTLEIAAGDDVGGYIVDAIIGTGGMGVVYSATHPVIGKRAAIKVLRAELSDDPSTVERFIREAKVVNQIRHPNIVDIFAIGTLPSGQHYLIMDLLEGETLRLRLGRGSLELSEALAVIDDTASALIAAHDQGVVHRDLKPDNVFLVSARGRGPEVKLLDFGVAKLMGANSLAKPTQTGVALGTPWYMSPEQARGRNVDHRTDIYALGVLAYETLTGVRPFDVLADGGTLVAGAGDAPPDLVATIERMISNDREQRPSLDLVRAAVKRARRELARSRGDIDVSPPAVLDALPTMIDAGFEDDGATLRRAPVPDDAPEDDGQTMRRLPVAEDAPDDGQTLHRMPVPDDGPTAPRKPVLQKAIAVAFGPPRPESVANLPRADSVEMSIIVGEPAESPALVTDAMPHGGTLPMPVLLRAPRAERVIAVTDVVRAQPGRGLPWRQIAFLVTLAIGVAVILMLQA